MADLQKEFRTDNTGRFCGVDMFEREGIGCMEELSGRRLSMIGGSKAFRVDCSIEILTII